MSDNLKGGADRVTNLYDFTGKVLATKNNHTTGKVTWQNIVAATVDGDNLIKTGTSATWGTSGASSAERIPAGVEGWVEITMSEVGSRRMVGLSPDDADQNTTSIKYGFYLDLATLRMQVNGSTVSVTYPLAIGDRLRIAREGGLISFYKNGIKIYPLTISQQISSTESLLVDVAMHSYQATVSRTRLSAGQESPKTVTRRFDYDHAGRLTKTWHKLNTGAQILLAQNEYNELGQLVNKRLYSSDAISTPEGQRTFKQSVDYRYNIRGWLSSINNSSLTSTADNPDRAGTPKDLFGMELAYEGLFDTGNTRQYNGNISAVRWSNSLGVGDVKENAYNYGYDTLNRIKKADFRQKKSSWGLPEHTDDDGNTQTSAAWSESGYAYDLNGNIQKLMRKTAKGATMDDLKYNYGTSQSRTNKLLSVTDSGDKSAGFIDGNVDTDDYTYDANGSMVGDLNKDIRAIVYNHLNLPARITKRNGEYIVYTYDATGRKLRQQVFNASAVLQKQSDYIGEHFYENDTLKFINNEEGRVVTTGATPEYQYFMKDHLGNVRMTFTTKEDVDVTVATMETASASTESSQYLGYDEAVVLNAKLFDHTSQGEPIQPGRAYYSMLLRGESPAINEKYGLAQSLSVMPGDTVKMEVFAKYVDAGIQP